MLGVSIPATFPQKQINVGSASAIEISDAFIDDIKRIYLVIPGTTDILYIGISGNFVELNTFLASFTFNTVDNTVPVNDPLYPQQWNLKGTYGINAAAAWSQTGNYSPIVAVIDTGILTTHPAFKSKLWVNTNEIPNNKIDDDKNGYVDDINGYNFSRNIGEINSYGSHGTWVSGVLASATNDADGMAGVCPVCRLMVIADSEVDESGTYASSVLSIKYAIKNKANIINASWGGGYYSQSLQDVILEARKANILVVAAAGNASSNALFYPASMDGVLSVSAINENGKLSSISNYGYWVDIAAPSSYIYTPYIFNNSQEPKYGIIDVVLWGDTPEARNSGGTSLAAPHVTGVAAMIISKEPDIAAADLEYRIVSSAKRSAETDKYIGMGTLDAGAAMNAKRLSDVVAIISSPASGTTISGKFNITGTAKDAIFKEYEVFLGEGIYPSTWNSISKSTQAVDNGVLLSQLDPIAQNMKKGTTYTIKILVTSNNETQKEGFTRIIYN